MILHKKFRRHFVLDVESDGPHPLDYNMISFGLVNVMNPEYRFHGRLAPLHMNDGGVPEAREVSGVAWEEHKHYPHPSKTMKEALDWMLDCVGREEPHTFVLWSDNPAFDWQFWNAYCWRYLGKNPAGFSARRIGDLDAGRRQAPFNTNAWKKWRQTKHTHDPVDDALGNVEALRRIINEMES